MVRFFRSKLFISIVLLLLAFIIAFVFLPKLYGTQNATVDVVQFSSNVSLGTLITEDMVKTTTIGKYGQSAGVITSADNIIGKYAARDIDSREYLYSDMFTDTYDEVSGALDSKIASNQKLMTIALDSASYSVGALIKPGSMVDILTKKEVEVEYDEYGMAIGQEKLEMELTELLTNVMVYKVQNGSLEDVTELTREWNAAVEDGTSDDLNYSLIPEFVTLVVTDEQATYLAEQQQEGVIHLTLHVDTAEDSSDTTTEAGNTEGEATQPQPDADINTEGNVEATNAEAPSAE
jgi:Flp pilus assembly protein CpaB